MELTLLRSGVIIVVLEGGVVFDIVVTLDFVVGRRSFLLGVRPGGVVDLIGGRHCEGEGATF